LGFKHRIFRYWFPDSIAAAAIRRLPSSVGVVLMYHEVLPDDVDIPAWTVVRESDFRLQMNFLRQHFDVVSMDKALERISGQDVGRKPFAVVTFDDGYRGNLTTVLPIMQELNLPFCIYVATAAVEGKELFWHDKIISLLNAPDDLDIHLTRDGQPNHFRLKRKGSDRRRWRQVQNLLTWLKQVEPAEREDYVQTIVNEFGPVESPVKMLCEEDLHQLAASDLVTLGSHTHGHELLDQLDPIAVKASLQTASEILVKVTGQQAKHFSYPNGNFSHDLMEEVCQAGYASAVTTQGHHWTSNDAAMAVPRISVGRFDTERQFKASVAGYLQSERRAVGSRTSFSGLFQAGGMRRTQPHFTNEPINILYIIDNLHYGGTERQLVQLINNLDRQRIRPHLCTLKPSSRLYDELDVPKIFLDFSSYTSFSSLKKMYRLHRYIRDNRIQIVQTFFQDPFLLAASIRPFNKVKLIGSFRDLGFWRTKTETRKMRLAYPFFAGFIANSIAVKKHFVATAGLLPSTVNVIYNGFDNKQISLIPPSIKKALEPQIVGIVGNFNRRVKRVDDFIRAAALVGRKRDNARFVIVGDGEFREELESLAVRLEIRDKIEFTGRVEDPEMFVRDFSVGVITSETEGFCNALVEYMANGIPVVATNTGGNPELVNDGVNGFLVPVGDVSAIAEKIVDLLEAESLRSDMGRLNQEKIFEKFTINRMVDAPDRFYNELLAV